MVVEERDEPVKPVERVQSILAGLVVQVPIALEGGVVKVLRWFSKVLMVPSGMVHFALEVLVPVGDLLMV
jgi:hypothetical protein